MNKKIIFGLGAALATVAGIVALSAYEAHVINVTAHIENALSVDTRPIEFGTVFPQEMVTKDFTLSLSESFAAQDRVTTVDYNIVQKPKPKGDRNATIQVCEEGSFDFKEYVVYAYCHDFTPENPGYIWDGECTDTKINYYDYCYLSLCPFLSKTDADPADRNDISEPSYFVPEETNPTPVPAHCNMAQPQATGILDNSLTGGTRGYCDGGYSTYGHQCSTAEAQEVCEDPIFQGCTWHPGTPPVPFDPSDAWTVDLKVPPIAGTVGQDWPTGCPTVPAEADYGCDLWIEVTRISEAIGD
jgi:hypothetical protein